MKAYLAFCITAIGLSTSCVMASTVNTQLGTADSPYIINVTQRYDERLINTEKLPGKAHLKLTHIAPSERHLYAIKISYEKAKNDVLLGPSELALPAQQKQQVQT